VPLEIWAGVIGKHRVTPTAQRMIVLAGSGCAYDGGSDTLRELSGIVVSNDVIRRISDEEGQAIETWITGSAQPQKLFENAKGVVEFSTDGTMVNTVEGWREIRLSVLGKREPGASADAVDWEDRVLNLPSARVAICAIAPCEVIGDSWKQLMKSLGLPEDQDLSVIADGAKWIWNQSAKHFTGKDVQWVVDIYHVMQYLHGVTHGLPKETAKRWVGDRVIDLIKMGGPEFIKHLNKTGPPHADHHHAISQCSAAFSADAPASAVPTAILAPVEAWAKLLNYLTENRDSLWYAGRLKNGQPIGSGLIEGGCKNVLGKRLKLNSARWCPERAEHMGAIRCLQYSGLWEKYWESKNPESGSPE
jgi:hypothetical protein